MEILYFSKKKRHFATNFFWFNVTQCGDLLKKYLHFLELLGATWRFYDKLSISTVLLKIKITVKAD